MTDKFKLFALILTAAIFMMAGAAILGGMLGYGMGKSSCDTIVEIRHDTTIIIDTLHIPSPPDTVLKKVPVPYYVAVHDTTVDSVWVTLPIEHHLSTVKDTADIWYSGFDAKIDSIRFYLQHQVIHETQVIKTDSYKNTVAIAGGSEGISLMYHRRSGNFVLGGSLGMTYDKKPTSSLMVGIAF